MEDSFAKQIYDEYLESIGHEFRTEDMSDLDYKDEIELIEFVLKRAVKTEFQDKMRQKSTTSTQRNKEI